MRLSEMRLSLRAFTGMSQIADLMAEIERVPHFRVSACLQCASPMRVHALQIYGTCPACGTKHKMRSFGAQGTELVDLIDSVIAWMGRGESFDAVLQRQAELLSEDEDGEDQQA